MNRIERIAAKPKEQLSLAKERKKGKPWKSCVWYPHKCDAVGCDVQGYPCREYKQEETW